MQDRAGAVFQERKYPVARATLARKFAAPADAVWQYVRWHGVAKLDQYSGDFFEKIEFDGDAEQVGITKTIYPFGGSPILERLEELNAAERSYRYRLLDVGDLPITDYCGYVRVTPAGPRACHLKIECDFTPVDVTAAEWERIWTGMETSLMDEISRLVENIAPDARNAAA